MGSVLNDVIKDDVGLKVVMRPTPTGTLVCGRGVLVGGSSVLVCGRRVLIGCGGILIRSRLVSAVTENCMFVCPSVTSVGADCVCDGRRVCLGGRRTAEGGTCILIIVGMTVVSLLVGVNPNKMVVDVLGVRVLVLGVRMLILGVRVLVLNVGVLVLRMSM